MRGAKKILIIGLDAADKDLILAWGRQNILPVMGHLLKEAAWGTVLNPPGLYPGSVWPSFCTGVSPARHGQYCFEQLVPGTYQVRPFSSTQMKAEPFWANFSRAGKRMIVLDAPMMALTKNINGIQMTDWASHDLERKRFQIWPSNLKGAISKNFGKGAGGWRCDRWRSGAKSFLALRDRLIKSVHAKEKLFSHFLTREYWDCYFGVFGELHCAGHHLWHWHDPSHRRHKAEWAGRWGNPLRDVYQAVDAAIGRLLHKLGPETTVFIYASHGMGASYDGNHLLSKVLSRLEEANGHTWSANTPFSESFLYRGAEKLWQTMPLTLRSGRFLSLRKAVRRVGVGRQTCFQVPVNEAFGGIRVNLKGREPNGQIHPSQEYEEYCEMVGRDLMDLVNLETMGPVVLNVHRTAELYPGEDVSALPDLLVEWNHEEPIKVVASPKVGIIKTPLRVMRSGDHRPEGFFFTAGPSVRPGKLKAPVSVIDFLPTFASFLEVPVGRDIQGRSFVESLMGFPSNKADSLSFTNSEYLSGRTKNLPRKSFAFSMAEET